MSDVRTLQSMKSVSAAAREMSSLWKVSLQTNNFKNRIKNTFNFSVLLNMMHYDLTDDFSVYQGCC
jgi:hypothetical protein